MVTIKHLRVRFGIRVLLATVTVIAVCLALWIRSTENQRRAAEAVLKVGGFVQYDYEHGESYWSLSAGQRARSKPLHTHIPSRLSLRLRGMMRPYLGKNAIDNIVTVGFSDFVPMGGLPEDEREDRKLTEQEWSYLRKLNKLEEVKFHGWVTDEDMPFVASLPRLRVIIGYADSLTDNGISELLKCETLVYVQLNGTQATPTMKDSLKRLPKIRDVFLSS